MSVPADRYFLRRADCGLLPWVILDAHGRSMDGAPVAVLYCGGSRAAAEQRVARYNSGTPIPTAAEGVHKRMHDAAFGEDR